MLGIVQYSVRIYKTEQRSGLGWVGGFTEMGHTALKGLKSGRAPHDQGLVNERSLKSFW